jgi:hypothetical protein
MAFVSSSLKQSSVGFVPAPIRHGSSGCFAVRFEILTRLLLRFRSQIWEGIEDKKEAAEKGSFFRS